MISRSIGVILALVLTMAGTASAQNITSSSIDGVITDQSGGTLPGVTVTVSCSDPTFKDTLMRAAKPAFSSSP